jgi:hypothetical protein
MWRPNLRLFTAPAVLLLLLLLTLQLLLPLLPCASLV